MVNGVSGCLNFVRNKKIRRMQTEKELKETVIKEKYSTLKFYLNERTLRVWAATEIKQLGRGGKSIVKRATGLDYKTLNKGLAELEEKQSAGLDSHRIRHEGGGRKKKQIRTIP